MKYLAYGSNLNVTQMLYRCPNSSIVGKGFIKDYKLLFKRNYLTIEPSIGSKVPVGVWEVPDSDRKSLDRYEGYPAFYDRKVWRKFEYWDKEGELVRDTVFIYIMLPIYEPSLCAKSYLDICVSGYRMFNLDISYLRQALWDSKKLMES